MNGWAAPLAPLLSVWCSHSCYASWNECPSSFASCLSCSVCLLCCSGALRPYRSAPYCTHLPCCICKWLPHSLPASGDLHCSLHSLRVPAGQCILPCTCAVPRLPDLRAFWSWPTARPLVCNQKTARQVGDVQRGSGGAVFQGGSHAHAWLAAARAVGTPASACPPGASLV